MFIDKHLCSNILYVKYFYEHYLYGYFYFMNLLNYIKRPFSQYESNNNKHMNKSWIKQRKTSLKKS